MTEKGKIKQLISVNRGADDLMSAHEHLYVKEKARKAREFLKKYPPPNEVVERISENTNSQDL